MSQEIIRRTDYHFTALRERLDELDKESHHRPGSFEPHIEEPLRSFQGLSRLERVVQEPCESAGQTQTLEFVLETVQASWKHLKHLESQEEDSIPEATGLEQPKKSERLVFGLALGTCEGQSPCWRRRSVTRWKRNVRKRWRSR